MKRLVCISDLHSGHNVGLTPPPWQGLRKKDKWKRVQGELWGQYERMVRENFKPDVLVVNGDAIDGRGEKSGSTELVTVDRFEQCEMASYAINMWEAQHVVMTWGTPYHTGTEEDFEQRIADAVNADKIGAQEWVEIEGVVFDFKHKVGSSSIPHGKATPIAKERLWNLLWTEHEEQPRADVIVRSHVHYAFMCGEPHWLAMTTPALQGQGSKFGARQCSGHVDFGITVFDCEKGKFSWRWDTAVVASQQARALKF